MNRSLKLAICLLLIPELCQPAAAVQCEIAPGNLAAGTAATLAKRAIVVNGIDRSILAFKTPLPVTTDGALDSYSLDDGGRPGINSLCNAVTVYRLNKFGDRISTLDTVKNCSLILSIFKEFRDKNWVSPEGFEISWQPGLVAKSDGDILAPCAFTSGIWKGFFASKTNLKQGLTSDAGECEQKDQIDPRVIAGITIQGGQNFIRNSGVQLGDLALASMKGKDGKWKHVPVLVIDSGGIRRPAMGTIALNAELLGLSSNVNTRASVLRLDIPEPVSIIIFPGSAGFQLVRPFEPRSLQERMRAFLAEAHLDGPQALDALSAGKLTCPITAAGINQQ